MAGIIRAPRYDRRLPNAVPSTMPAIDYSRFYRYDDLMALLRTFASEHPGHVDVTSIGRSHEGRDIPLVALTASSACLYFIDWLLKGKDSDPEIRRALDTRTFYICPRINPDGAEWAMADRP